MKVVVKAGVLKFTTGAKDVDDGFAVVTVLLDMILTLLSIPE